MSYNFFGKDDEVMIMWGDSIFILDKYKINIPNY